MCLGTFGLLRAALNLEKCEMDDHLRKAIRMTPVGVHKMRTFMASVEWHLT